MKLRAVLCAIGATLVLGLPTDAQARGWSKFATQLLVQDSRGICAVFSSFQCLSNEGLALWNSPNVASDISSRTVRTVSPQHGVQIEYLASNGDAFLWYPGNSQAVRGRWRIESLPRRYSARDLCVAYEANTVNPATGQVGGAENCVFLEMWVIAIKETAPGDPFGLSSGRVPWVLDSKDGRSLSELTGEAVRAK